MGDIIKFANDNGLLIDIERIVDVIDQSSHVYLYDTSAMSRHKIAFEKYGDVILKEFVTKDAPVILTSVVLDEMLNNSISVERYGNYLRQFSSVILIRVEDFYTILDKYFVPKQKVEAKFKNCSARAFSTITSLKSNICETLANIPLEIVHLFEKYFSKGNGGEYSLLWLSTILQEIAPVLKFSFIGFDRDFYEIVYDCHIRDNNFRQLLNRRSVIEIFSTETMLQALIKRGHPNVGSLCEIHRCEERKVLYYEVSGGIRSVSIKERAMINCEFVKGIVDGSIDVVY